MTEIEELLNIVGCELITNHSMTTDELLECIHCGVNDEGEIVDLDTGHRQAYRHLVRGDRVLTNYQQYGESDMKFYIAVEETRSTVIEVEAESTDEAICKVKKAYSEDAVCLNGVDYIDDGTCFYDETDKWAPCVEDGYEVRLQKI